MIYEARATEAGTGCLNVVRVGPVVLRVNGGLQIFGAQISIIDAGIRVMALVGHLAGPLPD